jgi:hypothetical protein
VTLECLKIGDTSFFQSCKVGELGEKFKDLYFVRDGQQLLPI